LLTHLVGIFIYCRLSAKSFFTSCFVQLHCGHETRSSLSYTKLISLKLTVSLRNTETLSTPVVVDRSWKSEDLIMYWRTANCNT